MKWQVWAIIYGISLWRHKASTYPQITFFIIQKRSIINSTISGEECAAFKTVFPIVLFDAVNYIFHKEKKKKPIFRNTKNYCNYLQYSHKNNVAKILTVLKHVSFFFNAKYNFIFIFILRWLSKSDCRLSQWHRFFHNDVSTF